MTSVIRFYDIPISLRVFSMCYEEILNISLDIIRG